MKDITKNVTQALDVNREFLWGEIQGVVVVFNNGDVENVIPLEKNTEKSAIQAANKYGTNTFNM